tara:strand:+ start:285 stop:3323 length:3039 start_codon:yes stop_codon:yes gene_type:complete
MSIIYVIQSKDEFILNEHLRNLYSLFLKNNSIKSVIKKIIISSKLDLENTKTGELWKYVFINNFNNITLCFSNNYYSSYDFDQNQDLYYFIINDTVNIKTEENIFDNLIDLYNQNNKKFIIIPKNNVIFLHSNYIFTIILSSNISEHSYNIEVDIFSDIKITNKKTIAVHVNQFSIRGSEIAIYDYACYISTLLKCNVAIVIPKNHKEHVHPNTGLTYDKDIENKFLKSFDVYEYTDLDKTLLDIKADIFYVLKSGEQDNIISTKIFNSIHCIFQCTHEFKHGDSYGCISENINNCGSFVVPHICHSLPLSTEKLSLENFRYVFGCYGGFESFDLEIVHNTIKKVVENSTDIIFIFMNIKPFIDHPLVKFYEKTTSLLEKSKFVNSCDAMIHARSIGESFGMAISEFTTLQKPIITWAHKGSPNSNEDLHHINVLGDTGIYYEDEEDLYNIFINFDKYIKIPINYSKIFTPESVMKKFYRYFIEPCKNDSKIIVNENKTESVVKHKIKILCNWTDTNKIHQTWKKLIGNNPIEYCEDDPDYWVIINKPPNNSVFDREKTIVLGMEPDTFCGERWSWYENKENFLYFMDENYRSNTEWWLNNDLLELENMIPDKTKDIVVSSIVSSEYKFEGHKLRIDFLKEAEKELDFDIYGWDNNHNFTNYNGKLENGKNDGLFPYKYTFIAENVSRNNFCTEKFTDAILSECLIFYWGCPNIDDFYDPLCYIKLDLYNITGSIRKIRQSVMSNQWEKRIGVIRDMKYKILNKYSFAPRVLGLIKVNELEKRTVNLEMRNEKWVNHKELCKLNQVRNVNRFNAVDGNKIDLDKLTVPFSLTANFIGNGKNTGGIIGCALSHYELWEESVKLNKTLLIMEDDVTFCEQFVDRLANVIDEVRDVLFIGFHDHEYNLKHHNLPTDFLTKEFNKSDVIPFDFLTKYASPGDAVGLTGGGTFGYLISPKGALKLLNCVKEYTFYFPVDYFMLEAGLRYGVELHFTPHRLIYSPKFGIDTDISDIQN